MPQIINDTQVKEWFRPQRKVPLPKSTDGYSCGQHVIFNENEWDPDENRLDNFTFTDGLYFVGCIFNKGLSLNCVKIIGSLQFDNCLIPVDNPLNKQYLHGVHFREFYIDQLFIKNSNLTRGVYFEKPIKNEDRHTLGAFSIKNCSFANGNVHITNTEIKDGFLFKNIDDCRQIIIENCQVGKISDMDLVSSDEIKFVGKDLFFADDLNLWRLRVLNKISFNSGKIEGDVKIVEPQIPGLLNIHSLKVGGKFEIVAKNEDGDKRAFDVVLPKIFLKSSEFSDGFYFKGNHKISEKIELQFTPQQNGRMVFSNFNVNNLHLTGTNNNSVFFRNVGFDKISIDDFLNLNTISFSNLNSDYVSQKESEFKIIDSNLGDWELTNFNFSAFKKVEWRDSQVFDLKSSSINWFSDVNLHIDDEQKQNSCYRRRELYRQLKLASEKQGDRINALEFKSRELKAYLKGLKVHGKKRWSHDRITLGLGLTNNHGQNWALPLFLILLITTVPFYPLIFMAADKEISLLCLGCKFISPQEFFIKFEEYGDIWPSLFNLARRLNDLFPGVTASFSLGFWDGLHRIVLAFFIFQIVSAFRKFVK